MTQAHTKNTADGHPRRTGQIRHQSPNVNSRMVSATKLHSRSCDTSPVRKRAGGNVSQNRPTYSSAECAACARTRAPNANLNRVTSGRTPYLSWRSRVEPTCRRDHEPEAEPGARAVTDQRRWCHPRNRTREQHRIV